VTVGPHHGVKLASAWVYVGWREVAIAAMAAAFGEATYRKSLIVWLHETWKIQ
jgi:hypothetical protein